MMMHQKSFIFSIIINISIVSYLTHGFTFTFTFTTIAKTKSLCMSTANNSDHDSLKKTKKNQDNPAMAFLRSKGRVGGASAQDFINAVGVDEGPAGGKNAAEMHRRLKKAQGAYIECTTSGVIDDLSETFPFTSSGNSWAGITDRVMGGRSSGSLTREECWDGKMANVLSGKVSLDNNGGFVQMATDLALNPNISSDVDASSYDGLELVVRYDDGTPTPKTTDETFNVHIKNASCLRKFSSYRASFTLQKGSWETVRLCWSDFKGKGPGAEETDFDISSLRRIGIVAIGKEMEVCLGLNRASFYNVI